MNTKEQPRDKLGRFDFKHESRPANIELGVTQTNCCDVTDYEPQHRKIDPTLILTRGITEPSTGVRDGSEEERLALARQGLPQDLDILVNDSSPNIRRTVAEHGLEHHRAQLINDPDPTVRKAVAYSVTRDWITRDKHSHYLNTLASDDNEHVRAAIVEYAPWTYGAQLLNDDSPIVRAMVAKKCPEYRDQLARDPDPTVRATVVEYGGVKYLGILKDDPSGQVQDAIGRQWDVINDRVDEMLMEKKMLAHVPNFLIFGN